MNIEPNLLAEIENERQRQVDKGHTPFTDCLRKNPGIWCEDIYAYVIWAKQMDAMTSPERYRRRIMQVAALAIAACEAFDRENE